MELREKQSLFARLAAQLILRAYALGYEVTLGDAYRSPHEAARLAECGLGIRHSLHTERLAIDLNLFRGGLYLMREADYRPLGEWWEQQHELCCWGGRFGDSDHYSVTHDGRK